MPLTADQLRQSLLQTAQQSQTRLRALEPRAPQGAVEGELRNALRDFRFDVNQDALRRLSNEQLADLSASILGAGQDPSVYEAERVGQLRLINRGRRGEVENFISNIESPFRSAGSTQEDFTSYFTTEDGNRALARASTIANKLSELGLSTRTPEQQFQTILGEFTPQAQVAREAQAVESDRQRVQGGSETGAQSQGRLGEPVIGVRQEDGTWVVRGTRSGTIFQSGLSSATEANAYATTLQSGSAPNISGRVDLFGTPVPEGQDVQQVSTPFGMVDPRTATAEELQQAADGTLANPFVAGGGTYLDGPTFTRLMPNLTEADIIRDGDRIYLRPGVTVESVETRTGGGSGTVGSVTSGGNTGGPTDEEVVAETIAETAANTGVTSITLENWDTLVAQGLKDAKTELDPYFTQQFARGTQMFEEDLAYQTELRKLEIAQKEANDLIQQEQAAKDAANSGLASSGIRNKAEARLAEQQENVARSQRLQFQRGATITGQRAEDVLGSTAVAASKIPSLNGTSVYTPTPGIRGSLEEQRVTEEKARATQLAKESALRTLYTSGELPTTDLITALS